MEKVLREVLVDYNLTDKVRIFLMFLYFFVQNTWFTYFVYLCVITIDNASNNRTMAASLEKLLKGSRSRFTKTLSCLTWPMFSM